MDKEHVLKYWTTPRDALMPHKRKLIIGVVVAVGMLLLAMTYNYISGRDNGHTSDCETPSTGSAHASYEIPDTCPWQLVMSDLTHRLRLLEMAFKEQVVAREVIAAEVTNQTFSNLEIEKKLEAFITSLRALSARLDKINDQMAELSSRLYSDECLGFLVLMFVIVQIILALRARLNNHQGKVQGLSLQSPTSHARNGSTFTAPRSLSNNSINGTLSSKQNVSFKLDVCSVAFNKRSGKESSAHAETLLSYVTDDVKIPAKQNYIVDSQETLKECPKAKLYIVMVDCGQVDGEENGSSASADSRHGGGSEEKTFSGDVNIKTERQQSLGLPLASLQLFKSHGGHVILVLTNDEGSQKLTSHSLYNTGLPLIQSHDLLQELASNGRVLSIWKDFSSFQLSHVKKVGRSLLSLKGK